jgi:hypothetical protein
MKILSDPATAKTRRCDDWGHELRLLDDLEGVTFDAGRAGNYLAG